MPEIWRFYAVFILLLVQQTSCPETRGEHWRISTIADNIKAD
jgi:hypothetical protein